MENTPYFESITSARSVLLSEEQALAGSTLISVETTEENQHDGMFVFVSEHLDTFLRFVRLLPSEDQELLFCYYILKRTQGDLAPLYATSQTLISARLTQTVNHLAAIMMFNGTPSLGTMRRILSAAGFGEVEFRVALNRYHTVRLPLAQVIHDFFELRSFVKVARKHNFHRPDFRRQVMRVARELVECLDVEQKALGAYLIGHIEPLNLSDGSRPKKREKVQALHTRKDPDTLGEFRVNIADPGFDCWFVSKANIT